MDLDENSSVIGRLLEEISWDGSNVRAYRDGGRGRENVLSAEVLLPLSYLPRDAFLAEILRQAHGAKARRLAAAVEMEQAVITLLPEQIELGPDKIVVQPDATMICPGTYVLVEAKRIRRSSFQAHQLPRELIALVREAREHSPLLLLVLGDPPPVVVKGRGRISLQDALTSDLTELLTRTPEVYVTPDELIARVQEVVAWITWAEVAQITNRQAQLFREAPDGLAGTVQRLSAAVTRAIEWHS